MKCLQLGDAGGERCGGRCSWLALSVWLLGMRGRCEAQRSVKRGGCNASHLHGFASLHDLHALRDRLQRSHCLGRCQFVLEHSPIGVVLGGHEVDEECCNGCVVLEGPLKIRDVMLAQKVDLVRLITHRTTVRQTPVMKKLESAVVVDEVLRVGLLAREGCELLPHGCAIEDGRRGRVLVRVQEGFQP